MSNGFLSMGPDYTPGTTASATGSVLDDILYQLTRPVETEGMFTQAEALFENAYSELSKIQNQVPAEQQADALAEYLRTSGFSSHVVEQTLGIPREEVNVALAQAGYSETGQSLEEDNLQNQLLKSSVTGPSDVFFDYVDLAEENKVPLTQAEFTSLVAKTNAATSNKEISQILSEAGIFHDTASLDAETGMDMGGRLMDRITITDVAQGVLLLHQLLHQLPNLLRLLSQLHLLLLLNLLRLLNQLALLRLLNQLSQQHPQSLLSQLLSLLLRFFLKMNILGYMKVTAFLSTKQQAKLFMMKTQLIMNFIKLEIHIVKESRF